jgi:hypothetical protein
MGGDVLMKQYTTRSGLPVRIYSDGKDTVGRYIHGAIQMESGLWKGAYWSSSTGIYWKEGVLCPCPDYDLGSKSEWKIGL